MAELKTFLFTDICRSVDLKNEMTGRSVTERDMAFIQSILTPHRERIEAHLEERGGRVVSTAGDGHFLVFDNTIQAAQWAVDVQQSHRDQPIKTPDDGQVEVRISIHVGVPQCDPADPTNFVGKSVDYASRLNDYATGAQILVSRSVMAILEDVGLEGISFHLHGRRPLKGIGRVEVHELLYDDHGPRALRQQPKSHSDRQWTVIPTVGFEQSDLGSDVSVASTTALKRVGNYELVEVLGSGGMGDVYKGRHIQFGRVRAIKVIKPQYVAAGNKEVIRRFYQEIKAIGALEHKNIVVAIDSSSPADLVHYLVMEYIDGVALHDLVEQHGPLSVPDACEIVRQAARGLQYIHRHGMVHRDIKPSNLMVTLVDTDGVAGDSSTATEVDGVHGVVKILDLGLALLAGDDQERLTRFDHRAMGTGMYMSPEQWKTTSVDIRADIYSLGCTLYHLLAGNPPFFDSDLRPEKAHEKSLVPPIRSATHIPRKLWEVLRTMLAKKPDERYATPAEVAAALAPFVEGHDLASLVRGYSGAGAKTVATRVTKSESGARIDTIWSRASSLYPTRRWLLRRGLPLTLVAGGGGFAFWMLLQSKREAISKARQRARNNLPIIAKAAVTNHIGREITKRFDILQKASKDMEMVRMVRDFDVSLGAETLENHPLLNWIKNHRVDSDSRADTDSWFINDRQGVQIARHPLTDDRGNLVSSFLKSFAYRNYFHGQGKDLPREEAVDVEPIQRPNISAVYKSSNSGKFKVAFSVPIWSAPEDGQQRVVVGVLSMSVDLGEFEVLDRDFRNGKDVVLIDLRNDYVEVDPQHDNQPLQRRGMILHHPRQSLWEDDNRPPRIDPKVLAAMDATPAHQGGFVDGYHDPLPVQSQTLYWGAFEPVTYEVEDISTGKKEFPDSGWVVLVQERAIE